MDFTLDAPQSDERLSAYKMGRDGGEAMKRPRDGNV